MGSQLESKLNVALRRSNTVLHVNSFFYDEDTAKQTAKRLGATAAIYLPKVVEQKDNLKVCFRLLLLPSSSKTYAMIPLEIPESVASEVVETVSGQSIAAGTSGQTQASQEARFGHIEADVREMRAQMLKLSTTTRPILVAGEQPHYKSRQAVVIGINKYESKQISYLQFAESDAEAMAAMLQKHGFTTRLALGAHATRAQVIAEVTRVFKEAGDESLVLVYFSGMTTTTEQEGRNTLFLLPADFTSQVSAEGVSIKTLRSIMESSRAFHKVLIVDGCNGTAGFEDRTSSSLVQPSPNPNRPVLHFLAGSQDGEYGLESRDLQGGFFTQKLLKALGADAAGSTRMSELFAQVSASMATEATTVGSRQHPKLVTIGEGEAFLPGTETSAPRDR